MTIYLIKWTNYETGEIYRRAFSNVTESRKKLNELIKDSKIIIDYTEESGHIKVLKPKTQADVINLINTI